MVTPWSFSLSALRALRSAQAYPGRTVAYFGLVTRNTSLVAKGTSVQNVTLPRPLVPYTQLQYRILAFVGKYTTLSKTPHGKCDHCKPSPWPHVTHPVDLLPHFAQGTLTFDSDSEKKFAEGDKGTFTVKKTKDKDEAEYDVEVDITYLHKEHGSLIKGNAVVGFASYRLSFTWCSSVSLDLFRRVVQRCVKESCCSVKQLKVCA